MITTVNRTIEPTIRQAEVFDLPSFEKDSLGNGIPLFKLPSDRVGMIKIEIVFKAGRWYEAKKMVSGFAARLLKEGTSKHTASEIAESFDFYGATVSTTSHLEFSTVKVVCLPRYVSEVMHLVGEILAEASFPQHELDRIVTISRQRLKINQEKVEYIASNVFSDVVFGPDHPYGYSAKMEDFDHLVSADLSAHVRQYYVAENCEVFITGCYTKEDIRIVDEVLSSSIPKANASLERRTIPFEPSNELDHRINMKDAKQGAIRVGYQTINKFDPNYNELRIVSILLGGFFGSRLMANIREDKGYTYGIYASLVSLLEGGYVMIATEVGSEYVEDTMKEISFEIDRLKNEPAPEQEIEMLRNYMLGSMMGRMDGPFKVSNVLRDLHIYGLTNNDHRNYMQMIKDVTASDIQQYAQKYVDFDSMYKVVVA